MSESYELVTVWNGAHLGRNADLFRQPEWDQITVPASVDCRQRFNPDVKLTRRQTRDRMRRRLTPEQYQAWRARTQTQDEA